MAKEKSLVAIDTFWGKFIGGLLHATLWATALAALTQGDRAATS